MSTMDEIIRQHTATMARRERNARRAFVAVAICTALSALLLVAVVAAIVSVH